MKLVENFEVTEGGVARLPVHPTPPQTGTQGKPDKFRFANTIEFLPPIVTRKDGENSSLFPDDEEQA